MRLLLTFILLTSFLSGFTQDENIKLDKLDPFKDSIVVNINISGHYFSSVFYNFSLSTDNFLSLNQGYVHPRTDSVYLVEIDQSRELDVIWNDLTNNNLLILPDQSDIEILINNNGNPYPMNNDSYQKIYESLRGLFFYIQIKSNDSTRVYSFTDSDTFYKFFHEKIYISEDIDKMHNIANIIYTDLDFRKIQIELVQNVLNEN